LVASVNTNFDPEFQSRIDKLQANAAAAGIHTHFISGVRSTDDQEQLYANFLAGRAGKPLPYPDRGPVPLAAKPGTSLHERGLAGDLVADNPADQARLRTLGNQVGLNTLGAKDPNHFEYRGPATVGFNAQASPATTVASASPPFKPYNVAGAVQPPPGTTINASSAPVAGALAKPAGGGFMSSVANIESNDSNIPSTVDKDYAGRPGSKSQGHWQIDTPTWEQFGAQAGIDLKQYPNAMSAPREVQEQVAKLIPLSRFGGRTVRMLNAQYGTTLDKTATLGELDAKYGGGSGGTAGAPAAATTTPAAAPDPWYAALTKKPEGGGKSPMEAATAAFTGAPQKAKEAAEEQAPEQVRNEAGPAPPAKNVSLGLANIQQTYGQTLNSFLQPLTWNSAPPQAPQMPASGLQPTGATGVPGTSLNSFQPYASGLGYGVNPVGFGFG
jgi:hypothetical protein